MEKFSQSLIIPTRNRSETALADIYEATNQLALAEALVEGILHSNPSIINDKKISRFFSSNKTA